jgi:hypothetical protein
MKTKYSPYRSIGVLKNYPRKVKILLKNVTVIEKVGHFCYKGAHFKNEARDCNYPLIDKAPFK